MKNGNRIILLTDTVAYKCKGSDPNDYIDSIFFSWNGDTIFEARSKAVSDSVAARYAFARADSGAKQIRIRVKDPDGLTTDSLFSVTILSGAPFLDSISPNIGVWVNDQNTYTIYARDLNGTVDSFAVDWLGNGTWEGKKTNIFTHTFDTTKSGVQPVKVRVMDEDSVWTTANMPVTVRLGRPIVRGASFGDSIQWVTGQNGALDTMFFKWVSGQPTTVRVDTVDTNGQCAKFYWDWEEGYLVDATTAVPLVQNNMPENTVHKITVKTRDDDSLQSAPISFYVYPDDAPPIPDIVPAQGDGGMKLMWSGKDVHDQDGTLYKILVKRNTDPSYTVVSDYRSGNQYSAGDNGYERKYAYTSGTSGISYKYKVVAKDARGSEMESVEGSFIYP